MGVTISCTKTGRTIDVGSGGFLRLRSKISELVGEPWASHYRALVEERICDEKEREKFYEDFDKKTEALLNKKRISVKIVDFCLQSDCEGSIRYGACKELLKVIGNYDDNMSFPTPASARNIHADGPWAIKFQPIPGETTISIHQIESSEGIIFSDGRRTAGRKYWTDEVQAWLTHCEQRRRVPQFNFASGEKPLTRKLWARLGVSLRITAEEEAVIFGADETLSEETIRKIILDGRFTPDGDSYVPEPAAEQFNEDYGTNHPVRDIGFEM
jgi:hypothetical protein